MNLFFPESRFFLALLVAFPFAIAGSLAGAERSDRPNVIFIMVDDMGNGDLGSYGQKVIQTPNIDRLAQEGMRFTDCYAGASVCAPSRSVLMTGQHLGHTRVRGNKGMVGGFGKERRVPLEPEDITLAQVMKAAGYITGMTGKWGLGEPGTSAVPNLKGFDEWFGYLNQAHAHTHYPDYLWHNQEKVVIEKNLNGKRTQHSQNLFIDFTLDFIRRHRDQPFFFYAAYTIPHQEYAADELGPYADKPWPDREKNYAAMIGMADRDVGRIMALLKEVGIDDNTLVFFCSDNGAANRYDGLFNSSGILRAEKTEIYEGGIRTPMIARWPGKIRPGSVSDLPWYFADVLPTVADVAGLPPPPGVDGISVLPTLLGKKQNLDRMLYWEQYSPFQQAVRWGLWKGIRTEGNEGESFELYNLSSDPSEAKNVAASHPKIVSQIQAFMKEAHVPSPNWVRRRG